MRVRSCVSRGFSPAKRAHRLSGYKWNVLLKSARASPAYNMPSHIIYYRNHGRWSLHKRLWNLDNKVCARYMICIVIIYRWVRIPIRIPCLLKYYLSGENFSFSLLMGLQISFWAYINYINIFRFFEKHFVLNPFT